MTKATVRARPPLTPALAWAAIAVGVFARVFSLVVRPLWADEIFTLTVARKSVSEILAALRVDSGPPLHYLFAYALLAPFPAPGLPDVLVRVLSLVASLLHLPLLFAVARRLGRPALGLPAAALFAIFPLAVAYAAEGRAYALASLLALAAFERALALRETPRPGIALGLAFAAAGAVLTHYLAAFPVAALAIFARDARPASRRASSSRASQPRCWPRRGFRSRSPSRAVRWRGPSGRTFPARSGIFPRVSRSAPRPAGR